MFYYLDKQEFEKLLFFIFKTNFKKFCPKNGSLSNESKLKNQRHNLCQIIQRPLH